MKQRALCLVLIVFTAITTLHTFSANAGNRKAGFTEIGHQTDGNYHYTFYADLSKDPNTIAYIQVQKNSTGEVLKLDAFKGKVIFANPARFAIKDKATVSFFDGSKLVSKDLTGMIDGGVKP